MEFAADSYPLPSAQLVSFGTFIKRVKQISSLAVSAMIGNISSAILTFCFALVGTLLGAMSGALMGQETESGFIGGAAVGALSGAVFSIEVFESYIVLWQSDESRIVCLLYLSDIIASLLRSLSSGRLVREKIRLAMLNAVQSQMDAIETSFDELQSIFDAGGAKSLSVDSVEKLPKITITWENNFYSSSERVSCSICLQDFQLGETARSLPHCNHLFHPPCIDKWRFRHGSCPLCRRNL